MRGKGVLIALIFTLLFPAVSLVAEEIPEIWHTRDLFFYDVAGLAKRLPTAPKLLVEFDFGIPAEERAALLAEVPMTSQSRDPKDASRVLAEFRPNTTPAELVGFANKLSRKKGVRVAPVFIAENIEAVIESIEVEPKITVSSAALKDRIGRFGKVDIRQIIPEGNAMVVTINEIKPPLNILKLTNLLHNDPWVLRARPRFRYLHGPIVALLSIEPISGTVGEERVARLLVRIFDPRIKLDETRLPNFGEGVFLPLIIEGTDLARATRPKEYFFEILGSRGKEERRDERSRTIVYTWRFKQYDLGEKGEWTIPSQRISYEQNGAPAEVNSNPVTMIVTSLIGALEVNDMPSPGILPYPEKNPEVAAEVALPPVPSYWYERWITHPSRGYQYGYGAAAGLGGFAALMFALLSYVSLRVRSQAFLRRRQFLASMESALNEAAEKSSYQKLSDAFSQALHAAFPEELPPHPTFEHVGENQKVRGALEPVWDSVKSAFTNLGERHKPEFRARPEDVRKLAEDIRKVLRHLKYRIVFPSKEEVL